MPRYKKQFFKALSLKLTLVSTADILNIFVSARYFMKTVAFTHNVFLDTIAFTYTSFKIILQILVISLEMLYSLPPQESLYIIDT